MKRLCGPPSWSPLRRGRLWGHTDANAELVLHAEAWTRRVQLNTPRELVRLLAQRPHTCPLVTVALRRDGSVESVTFAVASGVPEIDMAIRRLVLDLAPYPAFSPALARDCDVIEIRRTWSFDTVVRLQCPRRGGDGRRAGACDIAQLIEKSENAGHGAHGARRKTPLPDV